MLGDEQNGLLPVERVGTLHSDVNEWRAVTDFCEIHHGVIDRAELDRIGVTRGQLRGWIVAGRLVHVAPRVWRVVGAVDTWRQRLTIGTLSLGPDAAASHDSAARLHRLDRSRADVVEFLVPYARRGVGGRRRIGVVHTSRVIRPWDRVMVDGIRTTSATRTIFDLANKPVHPDRVRAAIDSAVRLQLSAPQVIAERLFDIRRRGRAGVRLIDELLLDSGGHTMLERRFLSLMREAGLPHPTPQVVFADGNRTIARVDFLYAERRIVVEVSGRLGHSTPTDRARDAQRRNELQDLGFHVYEFTWEDVTRRPGQVVRTMRRLLSTPVPFTAQHGQAC